MERIEIETSQNVSLEYDVANVGERTVAQLIDVGAYFAYFILMLIIISSISRYTDGDSIWTVFYFLQIPLMFYSLICEIIFQGQTLGKYIMKIKVVKIDGSQVTILDYFIRWILRLIDIWLFTGVVALISVLTNGKGQRLGDLAAGTTVLSLKQKPFFKDSVFRFLPKNYTLTYPEVKALNDNDIYIINDVINAYLKTQNQSSVQLLKDTLKEVLKKTNLTTTQHPKTFLDTIIKDYNYINQENNADINLINEQKKLF